MNALGLYLQEHTNSPSECEDLNALSLQLPENWPAGHSMRIHTDKDHEDEENIVISIPNRIFLILEVKNGLIEHIPRNQTHTFTKKPATTAVGNKSI